MALKRHSDEVNAENRRSLDEAGCVRQPLVTIASAWARQLHGARKSHKRLSRQLENHGLVPRPELN